MKSPYLVEHRLADVLCAIQVMGSHAWDSRKIEDWQENLGSKPQSANTWEDVLADHPEFFGSRVWKENRLHFLRLRRSYERTVDPETFMELPPEDIRQLKQSGEFHNSRLSRKALLPTQVEALMKTAIELQVRAAVLADRRRWWIPIAAAALGFGGAVVGSLFKSKP